MRLCFDSGISDVNHRKGETESACSMAHASGRVMAKIVRTSMADKECKTLPNESSVTMAELAAAEEAAHAGISLVKFGHITFDFKSRLQKSETGKRHRTLEPR